MNAKLPLDSRLLIKSSFFSRSMTTYFSLGRTFSKYSMERLPTWLVPTTMVWFLNNFAFSSFMSVLNNSTPTSIKPIAMIIVPRTV